MASLMSTCSYKLACQYSLPASNFDKLAHAAFAEHDKQYRYTHKAETLAQ